MPFRPGEQVALRYRNAGRISWVRPVTVVRDADVVALFLAHGTPLRRPVRLDGTPIDRSLPYEERFAVEWRLGDGLWEGNHVLMLSLPGRTHALWVVWTSDWELRGWYVNLQEPLRRTAAGFDTEDYVLDVWIPLGEEPRWKDEHDLDAAVRVGRFSAEQAAAIRAEGERVIAERRWPTGWEDWRPDNGWQVPEPQPDWES